MGGKRRKEMSFRRILYVFTIVALLSLLFTCRMDTGFGSASPARLPEDGSFPTAGTIKPSRM